MESLIVLSAAEQVVEHLRVELLRGGMSGTLPGVNPLAAELGVNHKTVKAALRMLEDEGLLVNQGRGLQRRIVLPEDHTPPALRVALLVSDLDSPALIAELRNLLQNAGHAPFFPARTLLDLNFDVRRVARLVHETEADAWVVAGASRDVLSWFVEHEKPAFALFGRRRSLPIAGVGPDNVSAVREVARRLIALGHQRIVLLVRESQRADGAGSVPRAMFEEMHAHGIPTGSYNLPDWKDAPEGFHRVLDDLFRVTAPTALGIDEPFLFHAAKDHLAQRGILAPEHVSLYCADLDPTFAWCRPSIAHITSDKRPVLRRVVNWVNNVSRGKDDRRQTLTKAKFFDGGTVGRAPA